MFVSAMSRVNPGKGPPGSSPANIQLDEQRCRQAWTFLLNTDQWLYNSVNYIRKGGLDEDLGGGCSMYLEKSTLTLSIGGWLGGGPILDSRSCMSISHLLTLPSVGSFQSSADLHQRTLDVIRTECWALQIGMGRGVMTGKGGGGMYECPRQTVSEIFPCLT